MGQSAFDFPALTYYPERSRDRMAYLTLFPIGNVMRANLMVYRRMDDPLLQCGIALLCKKISREREHRFPGENFVESDSVDEQHRDCSRHLHINADAE